MTSGAIQYGVPFIDLAPDIVAWNQIPIRREKNVTEQLSKTNIRI